MAHAHAMAHALGIPVLGVSSLAAVAAAHAEESTTQFVVATDARRKEVYCAVVSEGDVVPDTVAVMAPADAAARYPGLLIVGDGAVKYSEIFQSAGCLLREACQPMAPTPHPTTPAGSGRQSFVHTPVAACATPGRPTCANRMQCRPCLLRWPTVRRRHD